MSFSPIPKHLLIHDVIYHPPVSAGDGSMSNGKQLRSQTIKNVRFEPKRKRITTADNSDVYTQGILYIDAERSTPFINPSEDGYIIFQDKRLKIVHVYEAYTVRTVLHHVEVMLQ